MLNAAEPTSSTHKEPRGLLSCAECRRSKLKCDKEIPCGACVRRGCSGLCPDRTQVAIKGNKALMAHAKRLETEIKTIKSENAKLQADLANARLAASTPVPRCIPNPECSPDLIPSIPQEEVALSMVSLSIGSDGQTKYHGCFAGSEYLSRLLVVENEAESSSSHAIGYHDLPPQLVGLIMASPFGLPDCRCSKELFVQFIPPREAAQHLIDLHYQNASWICDAAAREELDIIVDTIYGSEGVSSLSNVHWHVLSVFFLILATGAVFGASSDLAKRYYALGSAALSAESILKSVTSSAVQALLMMTRYHFYYESSMDETTWLYFGACSRAAQAMGLHRDCAHWNLDPKEVQKRRLLFWEIFTWDSWSSFMTARPSIFRIEEVDCQFPQDSGYRLPNGEAELSFQGWKYRYASTCVPQANRLFRPQKTPNYSAFLEVDRRIRTFPLPTHLQSPVDELGQGWSRIPDHAMQQGTAIIIKESNLLYIHRTHFSKALRESPINPLGHKYSQSVLAAYRSARRLLRNLRSLHVEHQRLTSMTWYMWTTVFSACYIFGAIVVESPSCSLALPALQELERTIPFYEQGCVRWRVSVTLPLLNKLFLRARNVYMAYHSGVDSTEYLSADPERPDELAVLGGRASVIKTKTPDPASPLEVSSPFPNPTADEHNFLRNPSEHLGFGPGGCAPDFNSNIHSIIPQALAMASAFSRESLHSTLDMHQGYQGDPHCQPTYPLQNGQSDVDSGQVWLDYVQQLTREGYGHRQ